jgi:hypothetical protein
MPSGLRTEVGYNTAKPPSSREYRFFNDSLRFTLP